MSQKIKVGFYCQNDGYPNVDCRFPELGNPGLGGTQFSEIATAHYLQQFFPEQLEVLLLAHLTDLLPSSLQVIAVDNVIDAAVKSKQAGCDIFIFRSSWIDEELYEKLYQINLKVIVRSDDWLTVDKLSLLASCLPIKCNVCFSGEQLDNYRDHKIFNKSTRIHHPLNIDNYIPKQDISKKGNTVVFLGNIIPVKGFHILARIWPTILKERPDAKLVVIGSAKLYDRNQTLGKWGVAEEEYEANYIRPYLSDENGNIVKSVHFAGLVPDKNEILRNADVGVVNPSGRAEVFCISAVEFQACGTPVISAPIGGLLDTIIHGKTGFHAKNDGELAKYILYLLNNPKIAKQFGQNGIDFVKETFDYKLIAKQWLELLIDIYNNVPPKQQPMKSNYLYQAKFIKEGMRVLKKNIPLLRGVPSVVEAKSIVKEIFLKLR